MLVYINLPVVKLVLLYVISFKVAGVINDIK